MVIGDLNARDGEDNNMERKSHGNTGFWMC